MSRVASGTTSSMRSDAAAASAPLSASPIEFATGSAICVQTGSVAAAHSWRLMSRISAEPLGRSVASSTQRSAMPNA